MSLSLSRVRGFREETECTGERETHVRLRRDTELCFQAAIVNRIFDASDQCFDDCDVAGNQLLQREKQLTSSLFNSLLIFSLLFHLQSAFEMASLDKERTS